MGTTVQRNKTVDLLKVLLTVGIVFRHAELVGTAERNAAFGAFNQGMMLFTELCVPLFFVLSGFLYFHNVPDKPDAKYFLGKTRTRVFSLLIPYIIANTVAFFCYWLAYRYAPDMMSGFFGDEWKNPLFIYWTGPVNMSLWFIRDLLFAVICAPLTWLLVRYTKFWGVLALGLVWYFLGMRPWYNFFFTLGAWASVCKIDVAGACRRTGPWFLLMYICTFAAPLSYESLKPLTLLAGLPLCIFAADRLMQWKKWEIPTVWQAWCFFIYLYHYIPIISFKKLFVKIFDPSGFWSLMLVYVAVALITLVLMTALFMILKKLLPRTTGVLVGGKL